MEPVLKKQKRRIYLKGLLIRIIAACLIFLLLFLGNLFDIKIMEQDTQTVVGHLQNNSIVEMIENKLSKTLKE